MTEQEVPYSPSAGTPAAHQRPRPVAAATAGTEDVVRLALVHRDPTSGLRTRRVVVVDESDESPTRLASQATFAALDGLLRENASWSAPVARAGALDPGNAVAEWIYSSPAMAQWRTHLVPTAKALYVLQRPASESLLPGWAPVDALCRTFVVDGLDGIGIRTRARMMQDAVSQALQDALQRGGARWVSLACGAAVPVLDALTRSGATSGTKLVLVDVDVDALRFAGELAREQGLVEGTDVVLLERDLVRGVVARDDLVTEIGEGTATVVDALGIFEYFSDASCVRLLRNAHRLLAPGGVLVVANMLSDRRELDLNQRGLGWPAVIPRSREQLVALVKQAGLPLSRATVSTAQDGIYAVISIER